MITRRLSLIITYGAPYLFLVLILYKASQTSDIFHLFSGTFLIPLTLFFFCVYLIASAARNPLRLSFYLLCTGYILMAMLNQGMLSIILFTRMQSGIPLDIMNYLLAVISFWLAIILIPHSYRCGVLFWGIAIVYSIPLTAFLQRLELGPSFQPYTSNTLLLFPSFGILMGVIFPLAALVRE